MTLCFLVIIVNLLHILFRHRHLKGCTIVTDNCEIVTPLVIAASLYLIPDFHGEGHYYYYYVKVWAKYGAEQMRRHFGTGNSVR